MLKNVGSADRVIRILAAIILFALVLLGTVTGALAVVLGLVAAVLLVTGLVGTCPLYLALKISSNRKAEKV